MLKLCPFKQSICQITEEIIEFNFEKRNITRYCAIVEQAQFSLAYLIKIWNDKEKAELKREWFTPEKLAFYFY